MKGLKLIFLFLTKFALAQTLLSQAPNSPRDFEANAADTLPLQVEFLPEGSFFQDSVTVQLLAPGAKIYFTTDGSKPKPAPELRYFKPIHLQKTAVIRALAVATDKSWSYIFSQTYFINEPETTLPIVSLSIAPGRLFDPETGLYMKGVNAIDTLWQLPGANFWSRQETSCNLEFFETNGKCVVRSQAGLRLFGGMSRLFPQKSFALAARSQYGESRFRHPVFGKSGLKKYKHLVLRNSGSDFGKTHFRDGLLTHLVKDWDVDVQDYRPAHVYLNGKYWGIYNLREKVNRYFIAGHHHVDKDSLDLIEHQLTKRTGSTAHYRRLLSFLEKNSLASPQNFAWVNSQMEVNNFLDYQIAQIYFDNQDAGGNIKFWRPQTENGRWRWILYDADWGFGLYDQKAWRNNSLDFHTEPDGPTWPNPPWSTLLLRKLLENKDFERRFVNRFADYLNSDLESQH
ncbi:MAG: CotH kinase family protein, partial [Bacteroidota bacterium]